MGLRSFAFASSVVAVLAATPSYAATIVMCVHTYAQERGEVTIARKEADGRWRVVARADTPYAATNGCRPITISLPGPGEYGIPVFAARGMARGIDYAMPLAEAGSFGSGAVYADVFAQVAVGADETVLAGQIKLNSEGGHTFIPIVGRLPATAAPAAPAGGRIVARTFRTKGIDAGGRDPVAVGTERLQRRARADEAARREEMRRWEDLRRRLIEQAAGQRTN